MLLAVLPLFAQKRADIMEAMSENVTIHQDSAITQLIADKVSGAEREEVQISGYRVQVYSSNRQQVAKVEALEIEKRIKDADLQLPIYVQYNPPFWKVRVGDFRTQDEARLMKDDLVRRFPDLQGDIYVVRDQIIVMRTKE